MLKLYQFEQSPFCDKIRRVLDYKRIPYQACTIPITEAARTRRINRWGKMPVIDHDGRTVRDSTEIAHYLESAFPARPLLPTDPAQRALCHILEDWADESLFFYEMRLRFGIEENARLWIGPLLASDSGLAKRGAARLLPLYLRAQLRMQGLGLKDDEAIRVDLQRHLWAIATWLGERSWLVGGELTLADIATYAQLKCALATPEGRGCLAKHASIGGWMKRVEVATEPQPSSVCA